MKLLRLLVVLWLLVPIATLQAASPETAIKALLDTQVASWNRGDIATFVTTYAQDCIFVGKKGITQGRANLVQRYKQSYPSRSAMGQLTFKDLQIRLLDADNAVVTAHWHLDRDQSGGGPVGGVFSLVLHRSQDGWKIVLDHTG
jgi:uncharacterized protein (TIGR02246 family)